MLSFGFRDCFLLQHHFLLFRRNGQRRTRNRLLPSTLRQSINIQLHIVKRDIEEQRFLIRPSVDICRPTIVGEPVPLELQAVRGECAVEVCDVGGTEGEEARCGFRYGVDRDETEGACSFADEDLGVLDQRERFCEFLWRDVASGEEQTSGEDSLVSGAVQV